MERTITQQQASGRRVFVILAVIFFGPLLLAAVLFNYEVVPGGKTNKGDLVSPPVALELASLPSLRGGDDVETGKLLRGKWTLAYAGAAACGDVCENNLYNIRQIWIGTNREMNRVQKAWFVTDLGNTANIERLAKEHHSMEVLDASGNAALVAQFPGLQKQVEHIYLIDPQGFLMMAWQPDEDPRNILKDLKKVLKHSKTG